MCSSTSTKKKKDRKETTFKIVRSSKLLCRIKHRPNITRCGEENAEMNDCNYEVNLCMY